MTLLFTTINQTYLKIVLQKNPSYLTLTELGRGHNINNWTSRGIMKLLLWVEVCIKHVRKTNTVNSDCIKRRLPQSQFKPAGAARPEARAELRTYVKVNTGFRTYFRGKIHGSGSRLCQDQIWGVLRLSFLQQYITNTHSYHKTML